MYVARSQLCLLGGVRALSLDLLPRKLREQAGWSQDYYLPRVYLPRARHRKTEIASQAPQLFHEGVL